MLDKYSRETVICNRLHSHLTLNGYSILQLVSPGSQATFSVTFNTHTVNSKQTIFPDLIAIKDEQIFIGEIKARFSISDKGKLLRLSSSENGEKKIKDLVARIIGKDVRTLVITYMLIHEDIRALPDSEINQLILTSSDILEI